MTVIDALDAGTETGSSAHVVELPAPGPLLRALKNAMVCAGKDDMLPVLRAVQLDFDGEAILEVRSTDRFLAFFEQVGVEHGDEAPKSNPFMLLLPHAACVQAVAFLKAQPKNQPVTLTWSPDAAAQHPRHCPPGKLRIRTYEGLVELASFDGEFPSLRALVPSADKAVATEVVGLGRHAAQAIAKIDPERRDGRFRVTLNGPTRLLRLDWQEDRRTMLVPVRVIDGTSDWGVPGL